MTEPFDAVRTGEDVMIPMRDGVRLATDIYRPAREGVPVEERMPVLLTRTPYDKRNPRFAEGAQYFCRHGYVVAVQDVRGRYGSEGGFTKYEYEAVDGYDTIAWLAAQPYAEAKVGMWGTSYGAHTQADAAKLAPPALKTIVLNMGGISNGWDHKIRNHGAFELRQQLVWAFHEAAAETEDPVARELLAREPVEAWLEAAPLRKGLSPLSLVPDYEDFLLAMATRGDEDDWSGIGTNWVEYYEQTADIPMLHISGWYDSYAGGTIDNYVALSRPHFKRGPLKLIMGPWTHSGNLRTYAGEVEFGPDAALAGFERDLHLRWYDHFLKGVENGAEADSAIRLFVMGGGAGNRDEHGRLAHGGSWREADSWPLPGTRFERYYLHGDGRLSPEPPGDALPATGYTFDPRHPVPTLGGSFTGTEPELGPSGGWDQRERPGFFGCRPPYLPLKSRADVLVFQTDPLAEDVVVAGPIEVTLFASSSAVDTDFTAKLVDVYPPSAEYPAGFALNLTDGIIRARYRDSGSDPQLMQPGQVYQFTITPFPTANRFQRGHRIRLDISSSNFPRFDVNPNTGEPLGRERRLVVADNTVYHSSEYPSHVILPVVPVG